MFDLHLVTAPDADPTDTTFCFLFLSGWGLFGDIITIS